jgi:methylated-DNA-[protein]-cysteine S-methyltransferase
MPIIEHFLMESPLGTLTLVNTNRVLSGLYMSDHLRGPRADSLGSRATSGFDVVRSQLDEYFERKRVHFDLPIALHGTIFQQSVWDRPCRYHQFAPPRARCRQAPEERPRRGDGGER